MAKQITPCYQCPDRTPDCHGKCEKYKAFDEENKRNITLRNQYNQGKKYISYSSTYKEIQLNRIKRRKK